MRWILGPDRSSWIFFVNNMLIRDNYPVDNMPYMHPRDGTPADNSDFAEPGVGLPFENSLPGKQIYFCLPCLISDFVIL